jgi:hypothetical protein
MLNSKDFPQIYCTGIDIILFSTKLAQMFPKIGRGIVISATNSK